MTFTNQKQHNLPENLVLKKQILQICFCSLLLMCIFGKYSLESFLDTNQCSWIMMATTTMQHPRFMGSVIAWRSRGYDPHIHIINVYVLKIAPTTSLMARLLGARSDITNRCAFTIVWRNNLQPMTQRQKKSCCLLKHVKNVKQLCIMTHV